MKLISTVLLLCLAAALFAATTTAPAYVPNTDTVVTSSTVNLGFMHLNNKSGASSDCSVKDRGTACGGGACTIFGPATLGASGSASSVVSWDFHGLTATNGITWSCSTLNAVVGSINYY